MTNNTIARFWAKVDASAGPTGCWAWTGYKCTRGYPRFDAGVESPGRGPTPAARASWAIANTGGDMARVPGKIMATCGNVGCVNPAHLSDRTIDYLRTGFTLGKNPQTKLTADEVLGIVDWYRRGASYTTICQAFGITHGTVGAILSGKTWRHVTGIAPRGLSRGRVA